MVGNLQLLHEGLAIEPAFAFCGSCYFTDAIELTLMPI